MKPLVMTAIVFCIFFASEAFAVPPAAIKAERKSTRHRRQG